MSQTLGSRIWTEWQEYFIMWTFSGTQDFIENVQRHIILTEFFLKLFHRTSRKTQAEKWLVAVILYCSMLLRMLCGLVVSLKKKWLIHRSWKGSVS